MALDLARIRALCFDLDGTLSDTDDQFVQALARALQPLYFLPKGDPRPLARRLVMFTEAPGNFLLGVPDRLRFDSQLARLGDFLYRAGLGRHPHPFLLVPGAQAALEQARQRFPLSVVSARGERSARRFLEQFDLAGHFHAVATAQTCEHTKPYPDPILWAAHQMGVEPQACLMIGDTTVDIRAGQAAGAQTVGVLCGFGTQAELQRAGADLILPSTADLPAALGLADPTA